MIKINIKTSLGARMFLVGTLSIVLLIPAMMIQGMIHERQHRRNEAEMEIKDKWGNTQTIAGPILSVPFKSPVQDKNGVIQSEYQYAHFLPENLSITGTVDPELRYRGIYETVVYNTKLKIRGNFTSPHMKVANPVWEEAFVSIGITDMKGIKDLIMLDWNKQELKTNPGMITRDILKSGVSVPVPLNKGDTVYEFSTEINLNGSSALKFIPVGKETKLELSSGWANPSFDGMFLPETRDVTNRGFTANWKILHLNRNYPQHWTGNEHDITESAFGVDLLLPVDEYQKTMRTAKYAIMFISLTFLSFFLVELLGKKVMHPLQYLLIGLALLVFYTLLLSFSEHMLFKYAYWVASGSVLVMIALYARTILGSKTQSGLISTVLLVLYTYLFVTLQLQDYALLMGSLGLFLILALVMYLTRNVDWFSILSNKNSAEH